MVLFVLIVLPVLEILVLIQVGQEIGAWVTVLLLAAQALLGALVVKHEGRRAWRRLNEALASGRPPEGAPADAALILLGGVLLALPGFLTDVPALLLLLPFTRPLLRRPALAWATRRAARAGLPTTGFPGPFGEAPFGEHPQRPRPDGSGGPGVVRGEVIKDDDRPGEDTGNPRQRPLEP